MGRRRRITAGAIQDLELTEIIQMISLGRKTARMTVKGSEGEGEVWFLQGQAIHASTSDLSGAAAFHRIMQWRTGRFLIEHDRKCDLRTINSDTTLLLMESLQLRDERRHGSGDQERQQAKEGAATRGRRRYRMVVGVSVASTLLLGGILAVSLIDALPTDGTEAEAEALNNARVFANRPLSSSPFAATRTVALQASGTVELSEALTIAPAVAAPVDSADRLPEQEPRPAPPSTSHSIQECVTADPLIELQPQESTYELPALEESDGGDTQLATGPATGSLHLFTRSQVNGATLVILMDGQEVYRRDLEQEGRGVKWWFKRATGRAAQEFEDTITLPAGSYELMARLVRPNKPDRAAAINLDLESGGVEVLQLLLGRSNKKGVVWSPGQRPANFETRTEERPTAGPDSLEPETSSAVPYTPEGAEDSLSELVEGTY